MLKAVKKSTEVNKSKLKLTASTGNDNNNKENNKHNNNNNNTENDNNTSEVSGVLGIKRESIVGQKPENQPNDSAPLKKLSLKGNQLCGSILIGNYNVNQRSY